ncbi:hypothetical protein ACFLRN_04435 [Thermoproteota archaeon]
MKCIFCGRESVEKYCGFHDDAYRNVVKKFVDWKKATGVSWKEYLKAVVKNSYTGAWAKEIAEHLLKNKDG